MARLEKLQILGFRSFSDHDRDPGPQTIAFFNRATGEASPLTVILGQNGCGKTTIIECLKYSATGDPPPGSNKGQTFVHDPKMTKGMKESAGNVKLTYNTSNGDKYLVSRTLQAVRKKDKVTTKTLDGTIRRTRAADGHVTELSSKCADLTQHVLSSLGVSKAILNYVIFCHQEDSNWPLEEGSRVKAKFDEIFSTAKYNSALKEIKNVRQKELEQLRLDKKDLEFFEDHQRDAHHKKKTLKNKTSNKEEIEAHLEEIENEIRPLEKQFREVQELEQNFSGVQAKKTEAETKLAHYRKEVKDLRATMGSEIPADTTPSEEIRRMRRDLDQEKESIEAEVNAKGMALRDLEAQLARHSDRRHAVEAKIGKCMGDKDRNAKDKAALGTKLRRVCSKYGFTSSGSAAASTELELGEMQELMDNISGMLKVKREELSESEQNFQQDIDTKAKAVSDLTVEKAQFEEKLKSKRLEKAESKREIASLTRQLAELKGAEAQLEKVRNQLKVKEASLEEAKGTVDLTRLRESLSVNKTTLKKLDEQSLKLQEEKKRFELVRDKTLVINSKKEDMKGKQASLDLLLSKKNEELKSVFGSAAAIPSPKDIKREFHAKSKALAASKRELEDRARSLKTKQANVQDHRRTLLADKQRDEQRVAAFERNLQQVCPGGDFDRELDQAKTDVDKTRNELQAKEANKFTFAEFADRLTGMKDNSAVKPSCPTCNRHFEHHSQVDDLIEELRQEVTKIPSKVQSIRRKLDRAQAKLEQLQELLPEKKHTDELKVKLTEMERTLADYDREIRELSEKLTDCDDELDGVSMDHSACEDLVRDDVVAKISQLHEETLSLKAQIADLEDQMPDVTGAGDDGGYQDYDSVQAAEAKLTKEVRALRQKIESDQATEIDHERKLNTLQRERNDLFNRKLQIEKSQQDRAANEEKKADLESKVTEVDFIINQINTSLAPIADKLASEEEARSELETRKRATLNQMQREIESVKVTHSQLQSDLDALRNYEDSNNDEILAKHEADRDRIVGQVSKAERDVTNVRQEKTDLEKKLNSQATLKRNYEDNLKLRDYVKQETETAGLVDNYDRQLTNMNYDKVRRTKEKLQRTYTELNSQKQRLLGQQVELGQTIQELEEELKQEKLRDADENYRQKSVEMEVRKVVCDDLNKYYAAQDWAIMRFHQLKMEQINKIIRHLWKQTYQGTDIDYIEIKTEDPDDPSNTKGNQGEAEAGSVVTGADKLKRKVNYSVVMVKAGVEMEMRGRCSAGQKVLASLIIRLALAETFSNNCGVIALDEPTTNLDHHNIEALAEALLELVTKRSKQANFQLIVITHDLDLLELLSKSEEVDSYFKVSRNEDGESLIRKETFNRFR